MLRFEFLSDSYRCYQGHVSKLTGKSSGIGSNKSATVKTNPIKKAKSFISVFASVMKGYKIPQDLNI